MQAFTEGLIEGHIATDIIITISGWIITISGWAGPLPPAAGRGAYVIDPKEWQHSLLSIAAREVEFAGTTLNLVRSIGDQGQGDGSEMSGRTISDEFDGLDATEKAGIRSTLIRCRVLAAKIANELRNKRPEHFVDKLPLADIHTSLEPRCRCLTTVKRRRGAVSATDN